MTERPTPPPPPHRRPPLPTFSGNALPRVPADPPTAADPPTSTEPPAPTVPATSLHDEETEATVVVGVEASIEQQAPVSEPAAAATPAGVARTGQPPAQSWWGRREVQIGAAFAVLALGALGLGIVQRGSDDSASGTPTAGVTDATGTADEPPVDDTTDDGAPVDDTTDDVVDPSVDSATQARTQAIVALINRHWDDRYEGTYASLSDALDMYVGPVRKRAGDADTWINALQEDGLSEMTVHGVEVPEVSESSARAVAEVSTTSEQGGCANWVMRYSLVKVGGRWKIRESTADRTEC